MNEYQEYLMEMQKKYAVEEAVVNYKYGDREEDEDEDRNER